MIVVATQEVEKESQGSVVADSAESLVPLSSRAAWCILTTLGYLPLESKGYKVTFLHGNKKSPSELLPRVHRVVALLKRRLMPSKQGAVSHEHLDYYLDEFTPQFNRHRSRAARSSTVSSSR